MFLERARELHSIEITSRNPVEVDDRDDEEKVVAWNEALQSKKRSLLAQTSRLNVVVS